MRAIQIGERIHVARSGVAQTPLEFHWRGRRHRVLSIEGAPRSLKRFPGDRSGRQLNLKTTTGMRCLVRQEQGGSGWWMESIEQEPKEV